MATTVAEIEAKVTANTSEAEKNLKSFHRDLDDTKGHADTASGGIGGMIAKGVAMLAVADVGQRVVGALGDMVGAAMDANKGIAQTAAVLKSTHGVSGQTAQSVSDLADHFKDLDGIDDDVVRSAENMLLTFTNIKGDVFPQATQAALDMSTALGTDATQSSIMLGKALNDPINGVSALQRVGVTFNDTQKTAIAQAMKHGDVAKAQGIILKELGTEFGGSAKAAGDAAGPMNKLGLIWGDMQKAIGNALLPAMQNLAAAVLPLVSAIGDNLPGAFAALSGAVGPAVTAIGNFFAPLTSNKDVLSFLHDNIGLVAGVIGGVLVGAFIAAAAAAWAFVAPLLIAAAPFIAVGAAVALLAFAVKQAYDHFQPFHDAVDKVVKIVQVGLAVALQFAQRAFAFLMPYVAQAGAALGQFAGEIAARVQPIINNLFAFIHAALPVVMAVWSHVWPTMQAVLQSVWNIIQGVVKVAWSIVSGIIKIGLDILSGNWKGAWNDMKAMLSGVWDGIKQIAKGAIDGLVAIIKGAVGNAGAAMHAVGDAITGALSALGGKLADLARSAIENMIGAIKGMAGNVAGAFGSLFGGIHLPGFASGTDDSPGGLAMVGEHGPEVVALPAGARVYPSGTGPRLGGGGSAASASSGPISITIPVYVAGRKVTEVILPDIVREIKRASGK